MLHIFAEFDVAEVQTAELWNLITVKLAICLCLWIVNQEIFWI